MKHSMYVFNYKNNHAFKSLFTNSKGTHGSSDKFSYCSERPRVR